MSPQLGAGPVGSTPSPSTPGAASLQKITVRSRDGRYVLTGIAGPEPPETTDGVGGFEEVTRNRKPAVTQWVGAGVRKTTVTLLLDGWRAQRSVEPELKVVDGLAPPMSASEPQPVTVMGAPGVSAAVLWNVTARTISERLRRADGVTCRAQVEFQLQEYRPGDVVISSSDPAKRSAQRNQTPARAKPKTYVVKRGDTAAKIAAQFLGSAGKWTQLRYSNGAKITNPNRLAVGAIIRLP